MSLLIICPKGHRITHNIDTIDLRKAFMCLECKKEPRWIVKLKKLFGKKACQQ